MEMTSSASPEHPISVEIICATAEPPVCTDGALLSLADKRCTVQTSTPLPELAPGSSVIVRVHDHRQLEFIGLIEEGSAHALDVQIVRVSPQEKRYFPRENGGIDMHWKRLDRCGFEVATAAWRRGLFEVDGKEDWNTPEPFMNFSASGLRFRDDAPCAPGDIVLIAFRLKGRSAWHRAIAEVVRRTQNDGQAADIAVAFQELEPTTVELLANFTLDRQLDELAKHARDQSEPLD